MYGFLWNFAALRGNKPEWTAQAEQWQSTTYDLYKQHDAFFEFNSPTYSGVDIFGLALWRDYGFTPLMRQRGQEMEAGLWRASAGLYNANLRNISGPYDRSYGMDMQSYVPSTTYPTCGWSRPSWCWTHTSLQTRWRSSKPFPARTR
jgi:hypothetical protein